MEFKAHPYQQKAITFALERPSAGLFLDMGLGKSVISLTALKALRDDYFDMRKALIVAPKRVAEDTWPREAKKWKHLEDLKLIEVRGTPAQRRKALGLEGDVYVISRDNLAWLVGHYKAKWPFDVLILDELSSFKSHQSKRFKQLRRVLPKVRRVIGLTGTPAPNGYMDLWSQIFLLDRGERLGKTVTAFRRTYCDTLYRPGYQEYRLKDGAHKAIDAKLNGLCLSMKGKDYLDLKEPMRLKRFAKLSPSELKQYKTMQEEALLAFEDGSKAVALSAAATVNKLLQISNGSVYLEDQGYKELHGHKLDILEELIEEAQGSPILVFYSFKSDKERIQKRIKGVRVLQSDKDIDDWNAQKIKVLLAHPASAGHGLNLQAGGSIVVWFGLTYSLELYQQANARLHRQGQKEAVRIYHILTEGSIDLRVLEVLEGKDERQEELLRSLKGERQ